MGKYTVKDSGRRKRFEGGGVRDTDDDKVDYSLVFDGPMLDRWAEHLTKGARKYEPRNWMRFCDEEAYQHAVRSAVRHMRQWLRGDEDEDHAAAVFFNINVAEYLRPRLRPKAARYTTTATSTLPNPGPVIIKVEPAEGTG